MSNDGCGSGLDADCDDAYEHEEDKDEVTGKKKKFLQSRRSVSANTMAARSVAAAALIIL